jgi:epoxyqueuosine reductase
MARNAAVALGNSGDDAAFPTLASVLLEHELALVRGHAAWALGHIGGGAAQRALDLAWRRERDDDARTEIALALDEAT